MIPLNIRSHFSFMWGTASIKALCRHGKASGYTQMALTDTDNLCGMWDFINTCREESITPITGAEITDPDSPHRALCLVKNRQGYRNLCRLITRRRAKEPFSLESQLPQYAQGLCVLTRNPNWLTLWHEQGVDLAVNLSRAPLSRQHALWQTARRLDIPVVATPGSFFLNRKDARIHRMLRAIDRNTCLSRLASPHLAPDNAFLGAPAYYREKFGVCPETLTATHLVAEKCEFRQPDFGLVIPPLRYDPGKTVERLLYERTLEGARKRYGSNLPEPVRQRISYELDIIRQMNFSRYFLVVQDIVRQASRICGRGSGAASIVAYCLGITNVCPIKHNLYFERFLNPERKDPPDIDVDFAWDERDPILNWVLEQYKGHAAMVSSQILFQPRMAVREVARVFGMPDAEIGKVSKRLPWFWKTDEADADLLDRIRQRPEFRHMDFGEPWPEIMAYAQAIVGTPRYLSVHPGGVVIAPDPIDHYAPIEPAPKGVPLLQWEKDGTEQAGLVKIDLLGNRSLGVIRDAVTEIRERTGTFDDFTRMDPEDDLDTQEAVAQGRTMGCFYIESPATRLLQKKSKMGDFRHVVIHSSIIRPAANEFIQEYLNRLHTGIWEPIHPLIADVLDDTYGIMVYQEDVSKVAVQMAGFSHARADGLRKIMSKKDKSRALADYYELFKQGGRKKGVSQTDIDRVWRMIISFSGYSFCKPHSASYARVSFQAAYLKTHYPAHFMAAVISNQGGFYSTFAYVSEARRCGLTILPPDVNHSQKHWTGNGKTIRVGLMAISHLSIPLLDRLLSARKTASFSSVQDFFGRVRPSETEARSLIHSGSLDALSPPGPSDTNDPSPHRAALLWQFHTWQKQQRVEHAPESPSLFSMPTTTPAASSLPAADIPHLPPDSLTDNLRREFKTLGFLCDRHPICLFQAPLTAAKSIKAIEIPRFINKTITFAGWLISGKTVMTKGGDPMKFLTFEDDTGIVETVFFPEPYARFCHMLDYGHPYFLSGKVEDDWGAVTLSVESTRPVPVD